MAEVAKIAGGPLAVVVAGIAPFWSSDQAATWHALSGTYVQGAGVIRSGTAVGLLGMVLACLATRLVLEVSMMDGGGVHGHPLTVHSPTALGPHAEATRGTTSAMNLRSVSSDG